MHHSSIHQIRLLQSTNQTAMITAIAVLIASLMITAMLPTFLLRYVYAQQQLLAQPALLEYIPLASFVIGVGYFLIAIIGNILRAQRIKYLMARAEMGDDCACGGTCEDCHSHHHHDEIATMGEVDSLAEALVKKSKKTKRSTAKKTK